MKNLKITAVLGALLASTGAWADYGLNMTPGVTEFSQIAYGLHMKILWICVAIGVLVFGVMIYSMLAHRKSKGVQPAQFSHSTAVEIVWTVIPILILVYMAYPATKALITMEAPKEKADLIVKITGFQWRWRYDYLNEDVSFISSLDAESNRVRQLNSGEDPAKVPDYLLNVDKPLVLPVGKQIKFLLTADDVIHAWWVPALGWKRDAIPGFVNEAWTKIEKPGIYRGQCAELCGRDHGFMPIVIKAVTPEEFEAWLAEQKNTAVAGQRIQPIADQS